LMAALRTSALALLYALLTNCRAPTNMHRRMQSYAHSDLAQVQIRHLFDRAAQAWSQDATPLAHTQSSLKNTPNFYQTVHLLHSSHPPP
jgi:hypothetical protein